MFQIDFLPSLQTRMSRARWS